MVNLGKTMRINQYLASAGVASRRASEKLILEGRVALNGTPVRHLSTQVRPGEDRVTLDGTPLSPQRTLTLALNKPKGVVCSTVVQKNSGHTTVFQLIPADFPRLSYAGRLDADSEGLLILTNQGDLAQRLTHPRHKLPKTYRVRLGQPFDANTHTPTLLKGFEIPPGFAKIDRLHALGPRTLEVVLTQGLKRQIREMFGALGYTVSSLKRTRIGNLTLGNIRPGHFRTLSPADIQRHLLSTADDSPPPQKRKSKKPLKKR